MSLEDDALVFLLCAGPPILLLAFVCSEAPRRHGQIWHVSLSFLSGVTGAAAAFFVFEALGHVAVYRPLLHGQQVAEPAMTVFLLAVVGPTEEVMKLAAAMVALRGNHTLARDGFGMVLMAAASLGFAAAENWYAMYATGGPDPGRAILVPFVHMLFSSLSGFGLTSSADMGGRSGPVYLGLALASLYHGLYDVLEFWGGAWHWATMPLVVLLWLFFTRNVRPKVVRRS